MALRKGSKVWVEDRESAWVAGEVSDFIGKQVQVLTQHGKKVKWYTYLLIYVFFEFYLFLSTLLSSVFGFLVCLFYLVVEFGTSDRCCFFRRSCIRGMKKRIMEELMIWPNWRIWMSLECLIICRGDMHSMRFMWANFLFCLFCLICFFWRLVWWLRLYVSLSWALTNFSLKLVISFLCGSTDTWKESVCWSYYSAA